MIPEGVKVSAGDVMINLNLSKTFDGTWLLSYRPLDTNPSPASGSAFFKWISLLYHPPPPSAVVQVNGKWSNTFALSRSVCQGCQLSLLLYTFELLLRRQRNSACRPESVVRPWFPSKPMTFPFLCRAGTTLTRCKMRLNGTR